MSRLLSNPDGVALLLTLVLCLAAAALGLWPRRSRAGDERLLESWPHLVRVELLTGLAALAGVTLWALLQDPPLGQPADLALTPAMTHAPWFLVGVQELLQYFSPWVGAFLLPLVLVLGLSLVPFLDPDGWGGEARLAPRVVPSVVLAVLALAVAAPAVVGHFFRGPHWQFLPPWRQPSLAAPPLLAQETILGDWIILLPLVLLPLLWFWLRGHGWARQMGPGRFWLAGGLLALLLGAMLKVSLVVAS